MSSDKKGNGDGGRAQENRHPAANLPAQHLGAIGPAFILGVVEAPGVAGALDQLAAGAVADPLEAGRAGGINQAHGQGGQQMVQRRLVGFVTGLRPFFIVNRQAAMLGDEAGIFIMGQLIRAGGQRGQGGVRQGEGEVKQEEQEEQDILKDSLAS